MPRRKSDIEEPVGIRFEEDWSRENQDKCVGYDQNPYEIGRAPYTGLVRCTEDHPHRISLKVVGDRRYEIPVFPWIPRLRTKAQAKQRHERKNRWLREMAENRPKKL